MEWKSVGKDDIQLNEMDNTVHVWNHQPDKKSSSASQGWSSVTTKNTVAKLHGKTTRLFDSHFAKGVQHETIMDLRTCCDKHY